MSEEEPHVSGDQMEAAVPLQTEQSSQQSEQDRQVPLSALESERAKRHRAEDDNRLMKEHFELLKASQNRPQQPPPKDDFDGLDESDVMTVGEFKKLSSKLQSQFKGSLDEIKMSQRYPDYQDVVTKYLPDVLKTNPSLRNSLQSTQDYELAYYLAKNCSAYQQNNSRSQKNEDAERIIKNSQKSGSLSSLGASTPVSQAKRYKDMSDSEFKSAMHRNLGY